tara:strand:+ start:951 stop:1094 length:144 start_codon:yes stop_codon:yes gene_type:complete
VTTLSFFEIGNRFGIRNQEGDSGKCTISQLEPKGKKFKVHLKGSGVI